MQTHLGQRQIRSADSVLRSYSCWITSRMGRNAHGSMEVRNNWHVWKRFNLKGHSRGKVWEIRSKLRYANSFFLIFKIVRRIATNFK
jgi:hypothetical protein